MTRIKAMCPTCGEVDLTADDIDLRLSPEGGSNSYGFECPICVTPVVKPADERVTQLLLSGGVHARSNEAVPSTSADGPSFTYDDLIDFHFELDSTDQIAALAASVSA